MVILHTRTAYSHRLLRYKFLTIQYYLLVFVIILTEGSTFNICVSPQLSATHTLRGEFTPRLHHNTFTTVMFATKPQRGEVNQTLSSKYIVNMHQASLYNLTIKTEMLQHLTKSTCYQTRYYISYYGNPSPLIGIKTWFDHLRSYYYLHLSLSFICGYSAKPFTHFYLRLFG